MLWLQALPELVDIGLAASVAKAEIVGPVRAAHSNRQRGRLTLRNRSTGLHTPQRQVYPAFSVRGGQQVGLSCGRVALPDALAAGLNNSETMNTGSSPRASSGRGDWGV